MRLIGDIGNALQNRRGFFLFEGLPGCRQNTEILKAHCRRQSGPGFSCKKSLAAILSRAQASWTKQSARSARRGTARCLNPHRTNSHSGQMCPKRCRHWNKAAYDTSNKWPSCNTLVRRRRRKAIQTNVSAVEERPGCGSGRHATHSHPVPGLSHAD